jgi:hypothetical protein
MELERIDTTTPIKDVLNLLTVFAEAASKCTPELQTAMAMTINIAAKPPFIVKHPTPQQEAK